MNLSKPLICILLTALILLAPAKPSARSVMPTLEALARGAELIVIARVEEVLTEQEDRPSAPGATQAIEWPGRVATARVLEVWKGNAAGTVRFRASKSWICDVSGAEAGETVVLFLSKGPKASEMSIAYSGIGRLPIKEVGGRRELFLAGIILSEQTKRRAGIEQRAFTGRMTLEMLRGEIERALSERVRASAGGAA